MLSRASHAVVAALFAASGALAGTPATCTDPEISCQSTTFVSNLCCFNAPGGQLLLTEFWDTSPPTGPETSWTIHGLWPTRCDGSFELNCDSSRAHKDIIAILKSAGKTDLLDYMNKYWPHLTTRGEILWKHEWATHGTCISTLERHCYNSYTPTQEVADYFQKTVDLFKSVDSYQILAAAGIVPSTSKTYTAAEIRAAFTKSSFGFPATIRCDSGALNEIWYAYNVRGSVQSGDFIPVAGSGLISTCPATGIKYPLKASNNQLTATGGETLTTVPTCQDSTPTGPVLSGSGFLNAYAGGSQEGCLMSAGTWLTTGMCATYTATASGSGFTLKSSMGQCGISKSVFTCGRGVTATVFTACDDLLEYNGSTNFYAPAIPSGSRGRAVSTVPGSITVTLQWQGVSPSPSSGRANKVNWRPVRLLGV